MPMGGPPPDIGARVYRATNQTIVTATLTAISFSNERYDTDTIWVLGAPTRLTCRTPGKYLIGACVRLDNITDLIQYECMLREGGATIVAYELRHSGQTGGKMLCISTIYDLATADYLEVLVQHAAGADRDVISTGNYSPEFWMQKVG